jgi:isopenicillin-N epimerase
MASRRAFLAWAGGAGVAASYRDGGLQAVLAAGRGTEGAPAEDIARDETFWRQIQQAYSVDRTIINLNNGGVSPSPRIVMEAMRRYLDLSNEAPTHTMWRILEPQIEPVRTRLAAAFGCDREEIAITRNTSESMETCLLGLELRRGDEVLTTTHDYPRMLATLRQRERREGIVVKKISFPLPAPSLDDLANRFRQAITPRTRLILMCHMTNLTGQIFPVRQICQMARERGIEVVVDGAHTFAHFPFTNADLDCDYFGTSLHKWLGAPHGTGLLYVRRSKIKSLWPLMAADEKLDTDIRKFEEIGTHPAANHNAIAEALTFCEGIGVERKAARLRYLRDRWMRRLEGRKGARLFTSFDPALSCGLGTFALDGIDVGKLADHLWAKRRILVTPIKHDEFEGIRITPNVYTTLAEIDAFSEELDRILKDGLPAAA